MKEFINKYKYYIGGSAISLIIFYLLYDTFKKTDNSTKEPIIKFKRDEKEVVKAEISHEEFLIFMKTLKKELQSLTQSMINLMRITSKLIVNIKILEINYLQKISSKKVY